jgi:hypothetical protein
MKAVVVQPNVLCADGIRADVTHVASDQIHELIVHKLRTLTHTQPLEDMWGCGDKIKGTPATRRQLVDLMEGSTWES